MNWEKKGIPEDIQHRAHRPFQVLQCLNGLLELAHCSVCLRRGSCHLLTLFAWNDSNRESAHFTGIRSKFVWAESASAGTGNYRALWALGVSSVWAAKPLYLLSCRVQLGCSSSYLLQAKRWVCQDNLEGLQNSEAPRLTISLKWGACDNKKVPEFEGTWNNIKYKLYMFIFCHACITV